MLPRREWKEPFFGSCKLLLDRASFCCADKRHAEDVFGASFENACGSLTSLMHEASPPVKGDGRFIRSKDLEFDAREAQCESRVDRLSEKLVAEAAPAEISEQPHSEYARVPKAFALVRRDVTPADDFIFHYGYELNRGILAEKGLHVLQRRRFKEGQPSSLPRDRIEAAPEALRVSRGASSHGHVGELASRLDSPLALSNGLGAQLRAPRVAPKCRPADAPGQPPNVRPPAVRACAATKAGGRSSHPD
jgi:hypothetical protein